MARIPGPPAIIRRLTRLQIEAEIRASQIDPALFTITDYAAANVIVVQSDATPACIALLQQMINDDSTGKK